MKPIKTILPEPTYCVVSREEWLLGVLGFLAIMFVLGAIYYMCRS